MSDYEYQKAPEKTVFIKKGEGRKFKGSKECFTGDVEVELLTDANEDSHFSVAYVTFEAGARTAWHTHPCGQHLIVVEGIGLTQEEGGEILEFHEGEALYCPKDKKHWHGASPDCRMKHIAITGDKDGNNVTWLEHVTDEEYNAYKNNKK
ncbi:cupin domain-containing protein [Brachyspira innocens]|uniref:Cupin domain-containing protein n=1 Tax=Brachyspira innocens TaxID=13264 RepID=A0ABT8Z034_9SPIR|nr:cupin domain-containing protein [Brachyspira innocens]MDO6992616.1 cupin domain-containing protein [Brachyspira innocens]MDO7020823.1 cupin domain-containing protein [Brachyspira innocens]